MTRLFVDEHEVPFPQEGISSLLQVLRHVEATQLSPDSVIRQVHVDGSPVASEAIPDNSSSLPLSIGGRERIEVFTASLGQVARDSINEAISYLERVETVIPSLAASFQVYPGPEAFENLKQFYEGFYWLNLLLDRLSTTYHVAAGDVPVQGTSMKEQHERLAAILKQMVESHERGDFILISDLLEYEILPFIPVWKEIFAMFGDRACASA